VAETYGSTLFTRIKTLLTAADHDRSTPQVLISDLYEDVERDYTVNSRKSLPDLKMRWHRHLKRVFATIPATELATAQISTYVAQRQKAKAANASINRELAVLKRGYLLAIRNGRLKFGDRPFVPMLRENNVRAGFLPDAKYLALARATAEIGPWLRGLFELAFTYGWRLSELRGLRVSDVDLEAETIRLREGTTKNDDGRLVFMTAMVRQLIEPLVAGKAPDDKVFTRVTQGRTCAICRDARLAEIESALEAGVSQRIVAKRFHVSASAISRHVNRRAARKVFLPVKSFRKHWNQATEKAGCPNLLFHDLRRSGVRNLIRAGVTDKVAMQVTGHKTRSVFNRYNIINEEDLRQASALLELANTRFVLATPQPASPRRNEYQRSGGTAVSTRMVLATV
jgi:integrase